MVYTLPSVHALSNGMSALQENGVLPTSSSGTVLHKDI